MNRVNIHSSEHNMYNEEQLMANINNTLLASIVQGEQIRLNITLNWLNAVTGYTITATAIEADASSTLVNNYPSDVLSGGITTSLPIIDSDANDANFDIVFPDDLSTLYTTQPQPNEPVYAFVELKVADSGVGVAQQIWKPLRGMLEIRYSPTGGV